MSVKPLDQWTDSEVKTHVKTLFEEYKKAVYSKNPSKLMALYADDAVLTEADPNNTHHGRQAITDVVLQNNESVVAWSCQNFDEQFSVHGNALIYFSKYQVEMTDKYQYGTYQQEWELHDGRWQIVRDHYTVSSMKPKTGTPPMTATAAMA